MASNIRVGSFLFPVGYELASSLSLCFHFLPHFSEVFAKINTVPLGSQAQMVVQLQTLLEKFFLDVSEPNFENFHDRYEYTLIDKYIYFEKLFSWNPFIKLIKVKDFNEIKDKIVTEKCYHTFCAAFENRISNENNLIQTNFSFNIKNITFKLWSFIIFEELKFKTILINHEKESARYILIETGMKAQLTDAQFAKKKFVLIACFYQIVLPKVKTIEYTIMSKVTNTDSCLMPDTLNYLSRELKNRRTEFNNNQLLSWIEDPMLFTYDVFLEQFSSVIFRHFRVVNWAAQFVQLFDLGEKAGDTPNALENLISSLPKNKTSTEGNKCYELTRMFFIYLKVVKNVERAEKVYNAANQQQSSDATFLTMAAVRPDSLRELRINFGNAMKEVESNYDEFLKNHVDAQKFPYLNIINANLIQAFQVDSHMDWNSRLADQVQNVCKKQQNLNQRK